MSEFNTTKLAGHRVLITGDGTGQQCILDSEEFDLLKLTETRKDLGAQADEVIRAHFKDITDGLSALGEELAKLDTEDVAFSYVEVEGTEGTAGVKRVVHTLSKDTVVLRMIESGDTSRLVWVGSDVEITAV